MESLFIRHSKPAKKSLPRFKSGIPSFDRLLSGGFLSGTINLIEEDPLSKHFLPIIRCFLGEGASSKDSLFVYSNLLTEGLLPPIGKPPKQKHESMRIAWRYAQSSKSQDPGQIYDLSKSISYPLASSKATGPDLYQHIYSDINNSLQSSNDQTKQRVYIRLNASDYSDKELNTFLISLRYLIRSLNAVCLLTINMMAASEMQTVIVLRNVDFAVRIRDFEGDAAFNDCCGLMHVIKPLALQSLGNLELSADTFAIIRDAKFIYIDSLSLPPAESMQPKTLDY